METIVQYGATIVNIVAALIAVGFWLSNMYSVTGQNKLDVAEIKKEFREETKEIRKEFRDETKALSTEIAGVRTNLGGEIAAIRTDVATLRERMDAKFEAIMERLNRKEV